MIRKSVVVVSKAKRCEGSSLRCPQNHMHLGEREGAKKRLTFPTLRMLVLAASAAAKIAARATKAVSTCLVFISNVMFGFEGSHLLS